MSLTYAVGGASAGLTVVGLCTMDPSIFYNYELILLADLLFNGEGEVFNVRCPHVPT